MLQKLTKKSRFKKIKGRNKIQIEKIVVNFGLLSFLICLKNKIILKTLFGKKLFLEKKTSS